MTLADWLMKTGAYAVEFDGAYAVYSSGRNEDLWALSDYAVSTVSSSVVWLVPLEVTN